MLSCALAESPVDVQGSSARDTLPKPGCGAATACTDTGLTALGFRSSRKNVLAAVGSI